MPPAHAKEYLHPHDVGVKTGHAVQQAPINMTLRSKAHDHITARHGSLHDHRVGEITPGQLDVPLQTLQIGHFPAGGQEIEHPNRPVRVISGNHSYVVGSDAPSDTRDQDRGFRHEQASVRIADGISEAC